MVSQSVGRMSLSEFLGWDDGSDTRHELHDGRVVAMAPPSPRHSLIAANVAAALGRQLTRPCRAFVEGGVRIESRRDSYYQADIVVSCTPLTGEEKWIPEPVVVFEVLSPSTAKADRGSKDHEYRRLSSVRAVVHLWTDDARAAVQQRADDGWTLRDVVGAAATLTIDALGVTLRMSEIYDGVAIVDPTGA